MEQNPTTRSLRPTSGNPFWLIPTLLLVFIALHSQILPQSASELIQRPAADTAPKEAVEAWWSSELLPLSTRWFTAPPSPDEIQFKLSQQETLVPAEGVDSESGTAHFVLQPQERFQEILGIGMALEDTTLYALRKNRTRDEQKEVLRSLISPQDGTGFSLFRLTIGTSDFSDARSVSDHPKGFYSYRDRESDTFSIENDRKMGIIDSIRLVQEVARDLDPPADIRFFASCWSPPPWMKTSNALIGGTLKAGYEKELARYFRQFIEAYEAEGIPIYAMTMQNEPNFSPPAYPGMTLTPEQEADLVVAVWEEFHLDLGAKPEIKTRLWIHDHNFGDWERADRILELLEERGKAHYVDAVAFHNYDDAPASKMSELKVRHPDARLVFTEHSEWGTRGMYDIQQYFWNWSQSYMYWVAATTHQLDEHNQSPYDRIGELSPTLLIETDPQEPGFTRTPEYYLLGQFARFIRPGAVRIGCEKGTPDSVTAVSFQNPDRSIATILVNQTDQEQAFRLHLGARSIKSSLPPKTVGTYVWHTSGQP